MIGLPLVFLGGLLGSAHCVGMCGGFALLIGSGARSARANLARQIVYSLGRIFTYSACGAAVGYAGLRLSDDLPSVVNAQALLAIVAGAVGRARSRRGRHLIARVIGAPVAQGIRSSDAGAGDRLSTSWRRLPGDRTVGGLLPRLAGDRFFWQARSPDFCPADWFMPIWPWQQARRILSAGWRR